MAILGAFEVNLLGADGIALSQDGMTWFAGAGTYGEGWGDVGKGISVATGSTFYVRYFSEGTADMKLHIAPHGAQWGSWRQIGPSVSAQIGNSRSNPVILKFQHVGTPKSNVTWQNGSGTWSGIPFSGHYDLALQRDAIWSLPPVTITSPPVSTSWWQQLLRGTPETRIDNVTPSVPDGGTTAVLLIFALVGLAILYRTVNRRRARARRSADPSAN